jgi:luciferase family oxidoreductase group 1
LNPYSNVDEFPRQVQELDYWVRNQALPEAHPYRGIVAHPTGPKSPELWILGSSAYGAQLAAHLGLPYAFAYFFSDGAGVEEAFALYRRHFRPSGRLAAPHTAACVWALAADTAAEALRLLSAREHWRIGFEKGLRQPLISPESAAAYPYTAQERATLERLRAAAFAGSAPDVAGRLGELGVELELDEIVINTWTYDLEARRHSYELLANQLGLSRGGSR